MELVKGKPLIEIAEAKGLGTRQRLELFTKVCDAVQYAHHKGVIHRDLKPDNILVDDFGEPRILDFGIARATDSDIQATTLRTDIGQLIGTVPYMSPEQVTGDPGDLDTRSDVYSLGVVLYELLCGRLPHDLREKSIPDAVRVIREEEPTPLSSINRIFRGDIETIVAKALEKEKDRRYQTPAELAADVHHYLADEPIVARPPSTFYQLRKFARRNKAVVAGVAGMFILLLAGSIGTTTGLIKSNNRQKETLAEATKATAINDFLIWMLSLANPTEEGSASLTSLEHKRAVTILDLLDEATDRLDTSLAPWPLERAKLHARFGQTYWGLLRQAKSRFHYQRAYDLRRETLGDDHPDTLFTLSVLAGYSNQTGRHDEAESMYRRAAEGLRDAAGPEDRRTLLAMRGWGFCLGNFQQKHEAGKRILQEVLDTQLRVLGRADPATVDTAYKLVIVSYGKGELEAGERLAREWIDICTEEFGEDHLRTVKFTGDLGRFRLMRGYPHEAEQLMGDAYDKLVRRSGHASTTASELAYFRGRALVAVNRADDAEAFHQSVVDKTQAEVGENLATSYAIYRLGLFYRDEHRNEDAERCLREARDAFERDLGPGHTLVLHAIFQHAVILKRQGKLVEAKAVLAETMIRRSELLGAGHPVTLSVMIPLARIEDELGNVVEAERLFREHVERYRRAYGDDHPDTLHAKDWCGYFLIEQGKFSEAEGFLREAAETARRTIGDEHVDTFHYVHNLSRALAGQGRWSEAEPLAREVLEFRRRYYEATLDNTFLATRILAGILYEQGKYEQATRYVNELLADCESRTEQRELMARNLNRFSRNFLTDDPPEVRSPELGLLGAEKAVELSDGQKPGFLDTLALAHHLNGDDAAAARIQRRAIEQLPTDDEARQKSFEERLAEYESTAAPHQGP
jgi:tetratricopeptide (TPR) repeat protein